MRASWSIIVAAILLCGVCAAGDGSTSGGGQPSTVAVGDADLKGKTIGAYSAEWTQSVLREGEWQQVATLTETAKPTRHLGKEALRHVQTTTQPNGMKVRSTTLFDRQTLAPLEIRQEIENGPEGAPAAVTWGFGEGQVERRITQQDGQVVTDSQAADSPMFYGMTFGLVLAALPLEEGYHARLPVLIPQQGGAKYWLIARVVGRERFPTADGKAVEAWAVETDWADYESGEITSAGGEDQSGGTYWVVPNPPSGFPYVPKYANANLRIEVAL